MNDVISVSSYAPVVPPGQYFPPCEPRDQHAPISLAINPWLPTCPGHFPGHSDLAALGETIQARQRAPRPGQASRGLRPRAPSVKGARPFPASPLFAHHSVALARAICTGFSCARGPALKHPSRTEWILVRPRRPGPRRHRGSPGWSPCQQGSFASRLLPGEWRRGKPAADPAQTRPTPYCRFFPLRPLPGIAAPLEFHSVLQVFLGRHEPTRP
jgi:hypothetical protein